MSKVNDAVSVTGEFVVKCYDKDGGLKWADTFPNQVMTAGATEILDKAFRGSAYTAAWFMGLVTGPGSGTTYAAADTMASHVGWTEFASYVSATRPSVAFAAASAASIATSAAVSFSINNTGTVAGAFLTTSSTKSGTTGILYSAKDFTAGDRAVISGDVVTVTYSTTLTV